MTSMSLVTVDLQHAHSTGTITNKPHRQHKLTMFCIRGSLGKNISHLVGHRNILEFDFLVDNTIPNEMMLNPDMLGSCMKCRVYHECKSTLVIPKDGDREFRRG